MQTIDSFQNVVSIPVEAFVRLHPNPFLVRSGSPMRALERNKTRGLTVDRIVLEGHTPPQRQHVLDNFLAAEIIARDPKAAVITVGVSSRCDVQINDQSLSKEHAWFDHNEDRWRVWDNDSVAGTRVNDQPLRNGLPVALTAGDRITFGYVDVTFLPSDAFHRLLGGLLR
jgi:pSer/pThr/pTyr-binding forkhead associated (FHA) protein